jgi:hypothetical protein
MSDDIKRNWNAEAVAIAAGESRLLPQREHLQALAQHAEQSIAKTIKIASILIAFMVDNGFEKVPVPGGLLSFVRGYGLDIQPLRREDGSEVGDGTLVLTVTKAAAPTPKAMVN